MVLALTTDLACKASQQLRHLISNMTPKISLLVSRAVSLLYPIRTSNRTLCYLGILDHREFLKKLPRSCNNIFKIINRLSIWNHLVLYIIRINNPNEYVYIYLKEYMSIITRIYIRTNRSVLRYICLLFCYSNSTREPTNSIDQTSWSCIFTSPNSPLSILLHLIYLAKDDREFNGERKNYCNLKVNVKIANIQPLILKKPPYHEIVYMHSGQTWQRVLLHLVCQIKLGCFY